MDIETVNTILYYEKWNETVAFYQPKLRLQVKTFREWFMEFKLNAASRLSITDASRTSIDSVRGKGITIALEVDDIETRHLYLSKAGLNPPPIEDYVWGAKAIHIYDPEGNWLEFWSPNMKRN